MTLGGGEPTSQPEFCGALLAGAKHHGIHTAIETSGLAKWETIASLSQNVDLWLFDLKHLSSIRHKRLTGVANEMILDNLSKLFTARHPVIVRIPLIPGLNDGKVDLKKTLTFIQELNKKGDSLLGIEVLPYHRLGLSKYPPLGLKRPSVKPKVYDGPLISEFKRFFGGFSLPIKVVKHG